MNDITEELVEAFNSFLERTKNGSIREHEALKVLIALTAHKDGMRVQDVTLAQKEEQQLATNQETFSKPVNECALKNETKARLKQMGIEYLGEILLFDIFKKRKNRSAFFREVYALLQFHDIEKLIGTTPSWSPPYSELIHTICYLHQITPKGRNPPIFLTKEDEQFERSIQECRSHTPVWKLLRSAQKTDRAERLVQANSRFNKLSEKHPGLRLGLYTHFEECVATKN